MASAFIVCNAELSRTEKKEIYCLKVLDGVKDGIFRPGPVPTEPG